MIDFNFADQRLTRLVKDTRVTRGSEFEADNYLLVSKINRGQGCRTKRTKTMNQMRIQIKKKSRDAAKVCGAALVGRISGDAWQNDEIQVAVNEKNQAYLRKLNFTGLENDDRISLEIDIRDTNTKVKILVKECEGKNQAEVDEKMKNHFKENKKLYQRRVKGRKEVVMQSQSEL